jgi:GT2 family glycosyltransferase
LDARGVTAVVVTFNRKALLEQCLLGLLDQTKQVSKIIVIDNCSTDGTREFLSQRGLFQNPLIAYQRLDTNTGGAGGFRAGLEAALLGPDDWFWLMDDDVWAEPACLENLMKYTDLSECLHPRKYFAPGHFFHWEKVMDLNTFGRTVLSDPSFANGKEITFTNVGCFEGMLVSRRIVQCVGLPNPDYFIVEDDTLFGLKASVHTNVAYVAAALMKKLRRDGAVAPWKVFYMLRNRFYLRRDALDYLKLTPTAADDFFFVARQFTSTLKFASNGWAFVRPALRGFIDGLAYHRRAKQ